MTRETPKRCGARKCQRHVEEEDLMCPQHLVLLTPETRDNVLTKYQAFRNADPGLKEWSKIRKDYHAALKVATAEIERNA